MDRRHVELGGFRGVNRIPRYEKFFANTILRPFARSPPLPTSPVVAVVISVHCRRWVVYENNCQRNPIIPLPLPSKYYTASVVHCRLSVHVYTRWVVYFNIYTCILECIHVYNTCEYNNNNNNKVRWRLLLQAPSVSGYKTTCDRTWSAAQCVFYTCIVVYTHTHIYIQIRIFFFLTKCGTWRLKRLIKCWCWDNLHGTFYIERYAQNVSVVCDKNQKNKQKISDYNMLPKAKIYIVRRIRRVYVIRFCKSVAWKKRWRINAILPIREITHTPYFHFCNQSRIRYYGPFNSFYNDINVVFCDYIAMTFITRACGFSANSKHT